MSGNAVRRIPAKRPRINWDSRARMLLLLDRTIFGWMAAAGENDPEDKRPWSYAKSGYATKAAHLLGFSPKAGSFHKLVLACAVVGNELKDDVVFRKLAIDCGVKVDYELTLAHF